MCVRLQMSDSDGDFDGAGGAGASLTIPTQASHLKKGGLVLIKDHPCKIANMSTSKTGKHGHAKISMVRCVARRVFWRFIMGAVRG